VRRPISAAVAVVLALGLGACGREASATDQVRDTVEAFAKASKAKDYERICEDVMSRALVAEVEAAGLTCETAWRTGLGQADAPALTIRTVAVRGDQALVGVRSTATNQKPSDDVLELVREKGEWRIAALARPQPQPPATP